MTEQQQAQFAGWARVEVMGHQTHIGFTRTEAYGQAVLFRIDVPALLEREYVLTEPAYVTDPQNPDLRHWARAGSTVKRPAFPGVSVLVGAASIYRILPCTEEAAMAAIEKSERAPLQLVSLAAGPALPEPADPETNDFDEDDEDESEGGRF